MAEIEAAKRCQVVRVCCSPLDFVPDQDIAGKWITVMILVVAILWPINFIDLRPRLQPLSHTTDLNLVNLFMARPRLSDNNGIMFNKDKGSASCPFKHFGLAYLHIPVSLGPSFDFDCFQWSS